MKGGPASEPSATKAGGSCPLRDGNRPHLFDDGTCLYCGVSQTSYPRSYRGTPIHTFRLDDQTWAQVTDLAERRNVSAGDVVRLAIDEYLLGRAGQ